MARPCFCDRLPPPGQPYTAAYCRLCWLWHHDSSYRQHWLTHKGTDVQTIFKESMEFGTKPYKPSVCPHLWKRARDEQGKVKKRWCNTG